MPALRPGHRAPASAAQPPLSSWPRSSWSRRPPQPSRSKPIYPVYDGFDVTESGIYVISYAYFSHNFDPVTIPPGPNNRFEVEPADRGQTTTFLPGHHRFQCIMAFDRGFTGGVQWTLTHAGTTTSTSEDMLQYNWELDDRTTRAVLRDVDVDSAPRGSLFEPVAGPPAARPAPRTGRRGAGSIGRGG